MAQHSQTPQETSTPIDRYVARYEQSSLSHGLTLSRLAKVAQANSIIEVGCGAGLLSLHWLKNLPAGTSYTSIDLSEAMIKAAQQRKEEQKHQINNVEHEFRVADAHDLSFIPDESIDAYIAPIVYCHIKDPSKALSEAKRVLKNGGRIAVSMGTMQNNTLQIFWRNCMKKVYAETSNDESGQGQYKGHNPNFAIKGKDHFVQIAQEAGFEVDYCWVDETVFDVVDENDAVGLTQSPGMYEMYQSISEELKPKFIEILKTEFAELKKDQTPLKFSVLSLAARKP